MAVTDAQVEQLVAALDEGRQAWIEGKLGGGNGVDTLQDADMTIFGPFGGLLRGTAQLSGRQDRAASLFDGGSGRCELVKTIVAGDTVVLVLIERSEVRVQGSDQMSRSHGCFGPHRCSSSVMTSGFACIATPIP